MALTNVQKRTVGDAVLAQAAQIVEHFDSVKQQPGYEGLADAAKEDVAQQISNALGYLTHTSWPAALPQPSRRGAGGQTASSAGTQANPAGAGAESTGPQSPPHTEQSPPFSG